MKGSVGPTDLGCIPPLPQCWGADGSGCLTLHGLGVKGAYANNIHYPTVGRSFSYWELRGVYLMSQISVEVFTIHAKLYPQYRFCNMLCVYIL